MHISMNKPIKKIYSNKENFILIGLTGQIGSGCTKTAKFMKKTKKEHNLPEKFVYNNSSDRDRKRYIIYNHYINTWKPFEVISASDIITTFFLETSMKEVKSFLNDNDLIDIDINDVKKQFKQFHKEFKDIKLIFKNKEIYNMKLKKLKKLKKYLFDELPKISKKIKKYISDTYGYRVYSKLFQTLGDNLRTYGQINIDESKYNTENIYVISKRINLFVKLARELNTREEKDTNIVIDAFRNPIEMLFFREKYSAFYLFTINASENDINDRLYKISKMTDEEIDAQRKKENPKKPFEKYDDFISQNIKSCIQKGDIHISNNGLSNNNNFLELYGQIIKYISLIKHPGLITPSLDEKMMQIANTAKLNSGCLSRQVGASVTNYNGSLVAMGWNSVAEGQTPCLLRSKSELIKSTTSNSYSVYEKSNKFIKALKNNSPIIKNKSLKGLNQSFCFSEVHNKAVEYENNKNIKCENENGEKSENCKCDKNQVFTRSLHAEENAFLQIAKYGGQGVKNGTLYSTASPCELCSKKAYQLGISRVVYIDPYPGIAQTQILLSGQIPPIINLFKGAIGMAYHKLYEQTLPYKDELASLDKRKI